MLVEIPLLSFLLFGVTYPLCFWLTFREPIKHNFHRFHLACPVVIAGMAIIGLWFVSDHAALKNAGLLWLGCALFVTAFYWKRETVNVWVVTGLCLAGIKYFAWVASGFAGVTSSHLGALLLSGLITSACFYAMNLGHFYLNVHGLKIQHLKNAVSCFGVLLMLRLLWDFYYMATARLLYNGQDESAWSFMMSLDGFMLWVALFFGTLFPLAGLYFAFGTLKLKNTQATTGILYVLLSAVLLGDLAYKYYLLKFAVPM